MLEFLKEYWPLLVCIVLIIVAIVLLVVFKDKDKPEKSEEKNDNVVEEKTSTKLETSNLDVTENKKVAKETKESKKTTKENKVEEKTEVKETEKKQEELNEETTEQPKSNDETKSVEKKEQAQKYMVSYDKESKQWVVKKTGATRASKRCKTKQEAMQVAEKLAEKQDLNLTVKKKDGKFQKKSNAQ